MTPTNALLLRALIAADRGYRSRVAAGDKWAHPNERGVEIGKHAGWHPKSARALEEYGLCELVELHGHTWAFLGKYSPVDEVLCE
jgi:hypothetical protein